MSDTWNRAAASDGTSSASTKPSLLATLASTRPVEGVGGGGDERKLRGGRTGFGGLVVGLVGGLVVVGFFDDFHPCSAIQS